MASYTTFFVAALVFALVFLGFYQLITLSAKKSRKSRVSGAKFSPGVFADSTGRDKNLRTSVNIWGGGGHSSPENLARTHPAMPEPVIPWGWPSNGNASSEYRVNPVVSNGSDLNSYLNRQNAKSRLASDWRQNIGRPDRDGRPVPTFGVQKAADKSSREPTRRAARSAMHRNPNNQPNRVPWGW